MYCPLDYSLCCDTVTVYRKEADGVRRQVLEGVSFLWKDICLAGQYGMERERKFSLIVPGAADIRPGDRIFYGVGPEEIQWQTFLPVTVEGLCEASFVQCFRWEGVVCHTEVGG